jgi:predicted DNA-binding protein
MLKHDEQVTFTFRLPLELRESFEAACRYSDRPAGQVLREFMRTHVRQAIERGEIAQGAEAGPR